MHAGLDVHVAADCWAWIHASREEFRWNGPAGGVRFRAYVELMMLCVGLLDRGIRSAEQLAVCEFLVDMNETIDWEAHVIANQQFLIPAAVAAKLEMLAGRDAEVLRRIVLRRRNLGVFDDIDRVPYRAFEVTSRLAAIDAACVSVDQCMAHLRASLRRLTKPMSYFDDQDMYALTHALMFVDDILGLREARTLFRTCDKRLAYLVEVATHMAYIEGKYDLLAELVTCLAVLGIPRTPAIEAGVGEISAVLLERGAVPMVRGDDSRRFEDLYHATLTWGYATAITTSVGLRQ